MAALNLQEIVELGAVDYRLFTTVFFPKAFREDFPDFADRTWDALDSRIARFLNLQMFRGSSKTTTLRGFIAKRVAYAMSRTIMIIAASYEKATKTIRWLKGAIERNRNFAGAFQLSKGNKWTDDEIEIKHGVAGCSINIIAYGITGNVRGINIDDYRPDLIVLDDIVTDENAATVEQRDKIENLVLGAVAETLAPRSENPDGKMIMLQTPLNYDDVSMKATLDPMWVTVRQPCWTLDTENCPNDFQVSAWEKRFPTEELRQKKRGFIARNKASVFAREMEVRLVTAETSAFIRGWLRLYETDQLPVNLTGMHVVISVDPVPPPSDLEVAKNLHGKDWEAITAVGYWKGNYYLLEYRLNRGHDPTWTIATIFELAHRWRAKGIVVETIAYQKTLAWLIGIAMQKQRCYYPIIERRDKRSKYDKIIDALAVPASRGQLYCLASHSEFISQFTDYPNVQFDDLLDAVAQGISELTVQEVVEDYDGYADDMPELVYHGASP